MPIQNLEKRYQLILDKFGEFQILVHAPQDPSERFVEGPATVLYRLKPGNAVDPKRIYEKADALKLALELTEMQNIRFSIDKGFVTIDVPKSETDRYFVDASEIWGRWNRPTDALSTPIGEDRFGGVVDINFSSPNSPHLLIGGDYWQRKIRGVEYDSVGFKPVLFTTRAQAFIGRPQGNRTPKLWNQCTSSWTHRMGRR
jgi:S-DNA-T family DNA segregation ATPase FtsK/SpoIIIE